MRFVSINKNEENIYGDKSNINGNRNGFQTFSSVWDESYDLIDDDYQRYEAVAQLLKQIDLLNTNEKEDIFTRCLPIIQHNYQHFYGGTFEGILWNELKGMLKSLNDYFSH